MLIVLILVIAGLAWFTRSESTYEIDKALYRPEDLKSVNRIVLESAKGKAKLEYQNSRWRVNDSVAADRGLVEVIFATIQQAEPKRPVSESQQDSIASLLKSSGVKVSLYVGETEVNTFYAGGNEEKTTAWFIKPESSTPHVVTIPGYRVYVSGIFELAPIQWQEKLIFDFNWRNFRSLETKFRNPKGDFRVLMERNDVSIENLAEADTARLNSFLDGISLLQVEEYIEKDNFTDSLKQKGPVVTFLISDLGNRTFSLAVYENQGRFYGFVHNRQWAVLNENRILPLLRPKEYFVKR